MTLSDGVTDIGHWYDRGGNPVHFQENGKDTTLREARKQRLVPGFSGIMSGKAQPGLDKWKQGQLLDAAYSVDPIFRGTLMTQEDFNAEVKKLANERALQARERGSQIHGAIEKYIKGEEFDPEFTDHVKHVEIEVLQTLSVHIRSLEAETTFACPLGYGGMIDALQRSERGLLLDWKTKDREWDKPNLAYPEHGMQLAAYRYGAGLPKAVCANVFISPSANIHIHIWEEEELQRLWEGFQIYLAAWKFERKYDSAWDETV